MEKRLQNYRASADIPMDPFRVQMSLRFGSEGETRRVTALFWGNSAERLRLDVMAGIGSTAAKILEDDNHFLLYSVTENKAWFYSGAAKPLLQIGVPVPFDLNHLANLLNGRYALVFGGECIQGELGPDDLLRCKPSGKLGGELSVNAHGVPHLWRENRNGEGWEMRITYEEGGSSLPKRLTLGGPNGKRAIVLVKEYEKLATPFTDVQLQLILPEDTPLLPLAKYKSTNSGS